MIRTTFTMIACMVATLLFISFSGSVAIAAPQRAEAENPHKAAPRKRITLEQKKAAAHARKNLPPDAAGNKGKKVRPQHAAPPAGSAPKAPK